MVSAYYTYVCEELRGEIDKGHTIALAANVRMALMALGARFLNATPWTLWCVRRLVLLYSVFRPMPAYMA